MESINNPEDYARLAKDDFKDSENHCFFNENGLFCYDLMKIFKKGELIYDESPFITKNSRIGTTICSEDSEFLILKQNEYENVKQEFDKKIQNVIIGILKRSFPMLALDLIFAVYQEVKCVNLKKNEKIDNEKYELFCISKKGAIEVYFFLKKKKKKKLKKI